MAVDLRTYVFLDSLQLQNASFIATVSKGYYPIGGQACCVIEIAPGIEINRLTDIALKATNVTPGLQIVERAYGLLEVHSDSQGDARMAGEAVLKELKKSEADRLKPRVMTSQLIKNISDHHAQLINKVRHGNMVLRGDTLYVLEVEPAGVRVLRGQRGGEDGEGQHHRGAGLRGVRPGVHRRGRGGGDRGAQGRGGAAGGPRGREIAANAARI